MMKYSSEYENFKQDSKKFAKAGRNMTKSWSKLWWKLTKQWGKGIMKLSDRTYRNLKEHWDSLKAKTRRNLLIALAAGGIAWGTGVAYKMHSPQQMKTAPKIEQVPIIPETNTKETTYQKLASKKFGTQLLKKKPEDIKLIQTDKKKDKLILNSFPKDSGIEGKVMRCLRWKPLTDAAEKKYGIPPNLLLAMMAQEGLWDPTLPNIMKRKIDEKTGQKKITQSDWWLWLIHIQGVNAEDYGLKVLQTKPWEKNSRAMQDTILWKKILSIYEKEQDTYKLAQYDDRWNPVLSIDVAARFLRDMYERYGTGNGKDAWILALNRYSWREWTDYAANIIKYRTLIDQYEYGEKSQIPQFSKGIQSIISQYKTDSKRTKNLKDSINSVKITLNGQEGGYKQYLDYFKKELDQYGFQAYKKYHPIPSEGK